jgi:nitrogen fixation-related uncharacterized protein
MRLFKKEGIMVLVVGVIIVFASIAVYAFSWWFDSQSTDTLDLMGVRHV